jgi:hypothetical protein
MSYQLLRIEVERFEAGAAISGRGLVATHNAADPAARCGWVHEKPLNETLAIFPDKIHFMDLAYFLRVKPIGVEYDGIFDGDLDFQLTTRTIFDVLGPAIDPIMKIASQLTASKDQVRTAAVFVALVEPERDKYKFSGVLPLDHTINSVVIHDFTAIRVS